MFQCEASPYIFTRSAARRYEFYFRVVKTIVEGGERKEFDSAYLPTFVDTDVTFKYSVITR